MYKCSTCTSRARNENICFVPADVLGNETILYSTQWTSDTCMNKQYAERTHAHIMHTYKNKTTKKKKKDRR